MHYADYIGFTAYQIEEKIANYAINNCAVKETQKWDCITIGCYNIDYREKWCLGQATNSGMVGWCKGNKWVPEERKVFKRGNWVVGIIVQEDTNGSKKYKALDSHIIGWVGWAQS